MPAITKKMLTQQLCELEQDGIISRIIYIEIPPKVEYELSEYGWRLKNIWILYVLGEKIILRKYMVINHLS